MDTPPIYIISGGKGASGEQLVRTALAQFRNVHPPVIIVPDVRRVEQIEAAVARAVADQALIVHTLVNPQLRQALINRAHDANLVAIDLMGQLLLHLSQLLGQEPIGRPGLYRQMREEYFDRIEAIEFAVDHDDGRKPHELHLAEIVLAGVSRVGKTPLSMYLSTRGWKVANVPLIRELEPPPQLFQIDHRRLVGLTIDLSQLVAYRERRKARLGLEGATSYTDVEALKAEVRFARQVFQRGRFAVVDITDKPIEESAEEVVALVTERLKRPRDAD